MYWLMQSLSHYLLITPADVVAFKHNLNVNFLDNCVITDSEYHVSTAGSHLDPFAKGPELPIKPTAPHLAPDSWI